MSKANPICRVCKVVLDSENWYPSGRKNGSYICKECDQERNSVWKKANPEKTRAINTRAHRKRGERPFNENKDCAQYLGIHIAERVLSHVFKDVERMPMNHPGYDIVCNHNKRIDIKSSCLHKNGGWSFYINYNTIADFFLCLAFDNRKDLTPLHAWLLPGSKISHIKNTVIYPNTVSRWDKYRLDISKISACCDTIKMCRPKEEQR